MDSNDDMENIYQIKVTLQGIQPPIWRLFQVPGHFSFGDLNGVLQVLMSWDGDHLHEFKVGKRCVGPPEIDSEFLPNRVINEDQFTLERMITTEKTQFFYTYDFGDTWIHELLVEKIIPTQQRMEHPVCLNGKRAGALEDIGGAWGYDHALQLLKTPPPENPEDEDPEDRENGWKISIPSILTARKSTGS
jgi:hypothetical protein